MISKKRSARRAGVRGLTLAVAAILVLAIVGVSSASAKEAFTTPPRVWYTGAQPGTKLVGTRPVSVGAATELTFETSIGGTPISWSASGVACQNCVIENKEGTKAVFSGVFEFTGVKLLEPAASTCVMPTTVRTKALTGTIGGEVGSSTKVTTKITPTESSTWFVYELSGANCAIAGLYKWTGSAYGEFARLVGTDSKSQKIKFSHAIQDNLGWFLSGGSWVASWKFGENPTWMNGEIYLNAEQEFQVKEM